MSEGIVGHGGGYILDVARIAVVFAPVGKVVVDGLDFLQTHHLDVAVDVVVAFRGETSAGGEDSGGKTGGIPFRCGIAPHAGYVVGIDYTCVDFGCCRAGLAGCRGVGAACGRLMVAHRCGRCELCGGSAGAEAQQFLYGTRCERSGRSYACIKKYSYPPINVMIFCILEMIGDKY